MKLFKLSSIALLLATLFFAGCQSKSAKELIVNKWKLTEVTGEGVKQLSEAERKKMIGSFVMELTKDGKVIMIGFSEIPKTGTYTLSEDGKTLMLTRDGQSDPQQINELKAHKLVFTSAIEQLKLTFKPQ